MGGRERIFREDILVHFFEDGCPAAEFLVFVNVKVTLVSISIRLQHKDDWMMVIYLN